MKGKKMTRRSQVSSSSRGYSEHDDSSDEMESNNRSSSSESDDNDGKSDAEESHRYVAFCVCFDPIFIHISNLSRHFFCTVIVTLRDRMTQVVMTKKREKKTRIIF